MFMDIVGFTAMCKEVQASDVLTFLNQLFTPFDQMCNTHDVQKVETAGDCYIVAAGIIELEPVTGFYNILEEHDPVDSATKVLAFAKSMLRYSKTVVKPHNQQPVVIRIGLHTGPCVSGLIGTKLPKFSIFGDTMNTASSGSLSRYHSLEAPNHRGQLPTTGGRGPRYHSLKAPTHSQTAPTHVHAPVGTMIPSALQLMLVSEQPAADRSRLKQTSISPFLGRGMNLAAHGQAPTHAHAPDQAPTTILGRGMSTLECAGTSMMSTLLTSLGSGGSFLCETTDLAGQGHEHIRVCRYFHDVHASNFPWERWQFSLRDYRSSWAGA
eukprot:gene4242-14355_t